MQILNDGIAVLASDVDGLVEGLAGLYGELFGVDHVVFGEQRRCRRREPMRLNWSLATAENARVAAAISTADSPECKTRRKLVLSARLLIR